MCPLWSVTLSEFGSGRHRHRPAGLLATNRASSSVRLIPVTVIAHTFSKYIALISPTTLTSSFKCLTDSQRMSQPEAPCGEPESEKIMGREFRAAANGSLQGCRARIGWGNARSGGLVVGA